MAAWKVRRSTPIFSMNKKYEFAPATLAALEPFREYLKQEQFSHSYIHQTISYTPTFHEWLNGQSLALAQLTHADVMEFADQLRQKGFSIKLINQIMRTLRYYFSHLQQERQANHNPAVGIILKGTVRNIPHGLLTMPEMEALYESYQVTDNRAYRNKVVVGPLVIKQLARFMEMRSKPFYNRLSMEKAVLNEYAIPKGTSKLLLNYRDPFSPLQVDIPLMLTPLRQSKVTPLS